MGPIWMKLIIDMLGEGGKTKLGQDRLQLFDLPECKYLLAGHGYVVHGTAKESVEAAFNATVGQQK